MTFIDTRLSSCVGINFSGGPEWSTLAREMANGIGLYRGNWAMPHHRYTADYTLFKPEEQNEILAAFIACRGRVHSFRFKDWNDYQANDQAMEAGDGTSDPRQLTKAYTFGTQTYVRTILLPLVSTVVITANGAPISVTVDPLTGMVTPDATWPSGQVIRSSFEFDVRVRFGADFIPFDREGRTIARVTVPLVEAFTP
jgi:uncharacterized protein (TIGR02217 family)